MSVLEESLGQYRELSLRLDQKFSEIQEMFPESFACRSGCHSCCAPGLTVNRLEAESIRLFLAAQPALAEEAQKLEKSNPHRGKRCSFLRANGECLIYPARPLVCRSHGAPIQLRSEEEEETRVRDVCPLNFQEKNLMELPAEGVLNVDTINMLLALLTKRAFPKEKKRYPLSMTGLQGL